MHWRLREGPKLAFIFYNIVKCKVREFSGCFYPNDVCILSGKRTPIGSFQGKLATLNAVELGSKALTQAIDKACIDKNAVQEIILGNAFPGGCGQSIAFQIAMSAGLPDAVIHSNIHNLGGSGMKAVINGCQLISTNAQDVVAVGGVESTSNAPFVLKRKQKPIGNLTLKDSVVYDGMIDPFDNVHYMSFADETIKEHKIPRDILDAFALSSYSRAAMAEKRDAFADEMVPITVKKEKAPEEVVRLDEEIHKVDVENFRILKPEMGVRWKKVKTLHRSHYDSSWWFHSTIRDMKNDPKARQHLNINCAPNAPESETRLTRLSIFQKEGSITKGNSAAPADGAAMLILTSGEYALKKNLKPLARVISYADAALNRKHLVLAISVAIRKALLRANRNLCEIQIWEIDETFPVNVPLTARFLELDVGRININGGSISLGNPLGMTGARLIVHLAHTLCSGMLGCATICYATGGASAFIIEKL